MKTFDYDNYYPECPTCHEKIVDDVYYQINDAGELEALDVETRPEIRPVIKYTDRTSYPITETWEVETHYCIKCKKEYEYILPMKD